MMWFSMAPYTNTVNILNLGHFPRPHGGASPVGITRQDLSSWWGYLLVNVVYADSIYVRSWLWREKTPYSVKGFKIGFGWGDFSHYCHWIRIENILCGYWLMYVLYYGDAYLVFLNFVSVLKVHFEYIFFSFRRVIRQPLRWHMNVSWSALTHANHQKL